MGYKLYRVTAPFHNHKTGRDVKENDLLYGNFINAGDCLHFPPNDEAVAIYDFNYFEEITLEEGDILEYFYDGPGRSTKLPGKELQFLHFYANHGEIKVKLATSSIPSWKFRFIRRKTEGCNVVLNPNRITTAAVARRIVEKFPCKCDILTIMKNGCICGAINKHEPFKLIT